MAILIGTDEAGYGPNLGPLVISATTWQVPADLLEADFYELLGAGVQASADPASPGLPIADSKTLYQAGGGLGALETSVLAAAVTLGTEVRTWDDVWQTFAPQSVAWRDQLPWYDGYQASVPQDAALDEIVARGRRFASHLATCDIRLLAMRSVAIFPPRLNALIDRFDTKGGALSFETLKLVREQLATWDGEPAVILCDKHGGRNRYAPVLQTVFPAILPTVVAESRQQSVYRWQDGGQRREIRFSARGETALCTALASMLSKYLRELAMSGFNTFWLNQVPGIRPTAGYPVDAKRFRSEIEPARMRLGIRDAQLWRKR